MDSTLDDLAAAKAPPVRSDDLSAVAWVHDELRRSLDAAHKSLRRYVKDSETISGSDIDVVDPAVLRAARAQIHQGVGALELVGLPVAATVLRASESAVQRGVSRPQTLTHELVADIERLSFALLDYLTRILAGKQVSPLALFPQYRAVQEAGEVDRIHPADLWPVDWRWREVPNDPDALPRAADAAVRGQLESHLLSLMRGVQALTAASRMSDICAGLAAGTSHPHVATFWNLAAAMFEAQHHGLLGFDVFTKRVTSRLLAQFRILQRGDSDVSERLARDLLFFCGQAAPAGRGVRVVRLTAARTAYGLDQPPSDYSVSALGRFDPAQIVHAKKRVASAKEAWSTTAGGEMHRLAGLPEQFSLVGDSLRKLFPFGEAFAAELHGAASDAEQAQAAPPAALAMEIATSLLYVEAALEDGDFDNPAHAERIRRLAHRLASVRQGHAPEPLEGWMEELYRRVSDRQTMGSVVHELRVSLGEVEKAIDQFFRDPADHSVLVNVPVQLTSMRGVLSVLGMDQAAQALVRMRGEVDGLASTEIEPEHVAQAGVFDRLAGNLSALGFMIDMLSVQPHMAKSLFAYDPQTGVIAPVMGRAAGEAPPAPPGPVEPRLIEQAQLLAFSAVREDVGLDDVRRDLERLSHEAQAADQPALAAAVLRAQEAIRGAAHDEHDLAAARGELSEALVDYVSAVTDPSVFAPISEPAPLPTARSAAQAETGAGDEDDDMREVFLEEAREVIEAAEAASGELRATPGDLTLLTTVRRAFHTLKGSSRMVGLKAFGEAAWACEQAFNAQLAEQRPAEPPLLEFTGWALAYLDRWIEDVAAHRDADRTEAEVKVAAERLARRLDGGASPDIDLPFGMPVDLPTRDDLDLITPSEQGGFAPSGHDRDPEPAMEELAFELDLSGPEAATDRRAAEPVRADPAVLDDERAAAMFDPFDPTPADGALQPAMASAESRPEPTTGSVDLDLDLDVDVDLGEPTFEATAVLLPEAPSGATAVPASLGLMLDLSSGEALPAAAASRGRSGLDIVIDDAGGADPEDDAGSAANDEHVKVVGPLRIGIPLFNIYLNEADELSRRLMTELAEWAMERHQPIGEVAVSLAHSLAGSSATVGFADLSHLSRALEHALARSRAIGRGTDEEARLFVQTAEEIRRLLHQFAAGFLKSPVPDLLTRLADHERSSAVRLDAANAAAELDEPSDSESGAALVPDDGPDLDFGPSTGGPDAAPAADEVPVSEAGGDPARLGDADSTSVEAEEPPAPPAPVDAPTVTPAAPQPTFEDDEAAEPAEAASAFEAAETEVSSAESSPAEPAGAEQEEAQALPAQEAAAPPAAPAPFAALAAAGTLGVSDLKPLGDAPVETPRGTAAHSQFDAGDDEIDAVDAVDAELFPIFADEADELLPKLASQLRAWAAQPAASANGAACMRTLHTLKGGARLAGAMRLGEMAHRLETRIERLVGNEGDPGADDIEALQVRSDAMADAFAALRRGDLGSAEDGEGVDAIAEPQAAVSADRSAVSEAVEPASVDAFSTDPVEVPLVDLADDATPDAAPAAPPAADPSPEPVPELLPASRGKRQRPPRVASTPPTAQSTAAPLTPPAAIDWTRFLRRDSGPARPVDRAAASSQAAVRVRATLLDRMVNQAGEVSITRSRIEAGVGQIKLSLTDLTENLERLRGQLRELELQGEIQMTSRLEAAKAAAQAFDPLEFDRFTRFQELTRMMAESVNDVATVQRSLQRSFESAEDDLVAQARLTRDLQDDLLRTRMVEFEGLSDRLYRVVRQTAKESGKQVRLDIVGGSIEVDRGVLDRMTGAFEHLLRNCVSHGIESPEVRTQAGKDPIGTIVMAVSHEGNEVGIEVRDDGAGLDLARIREKAEALQLIDPAVEPDETALANLIFAPGFTTVDKVTELAGRGVGMDVVRSDVIAMGGRIETATAAGRGTSFKLIVPLTTAVTQVVMIRCGETVVAVPSTLVEIVRRATTAELDAASASGSYMFGDRPLPFFWLGALLLQGNQPLSDVAGRIRSIVIVRSAQQRIAVLVDEVLGNQEVVVKNLGPQLSRLPGLAGMTLLASGAVVLIYNPVALATLYGDAARVSAQASQAAQASPGSTPSVPVAALPGAGQPARAPLVLVVDDSLTVRRVTQRMLAREGYRVALAKDGLDAIERLAEEVPSVVLCDIEMPRMDGFDLVRNLRADARWRALPVIMITSRIAQKHRDHAAELGVDHYLGKPYSEEDLLALVSGYIESSAQA